MTGNFDKSALFAGYDAIVRHAGWRWADERIAVRAAGDDRVSFLHGMCSNDVRGMLAGEIIPALLLTDHAHIVADPIIWADHDALFLEIEGELWARTHEHLEKFLIADDVEFEHGETTALLDIAGPAAAALVARIAPSAAGIAPWRFVESAGLRIANLPRLGVPSFTFMGERERLLPIAAQLRGLSEAAEVAAAAFEMVRVEQGLARVGVDTGERTLAQEARMDRAISFSKGCYIGQETIERATAHGSLKKKLMGLRVAGENDPNRGAAIALDGHEVGRLTSFARSPRLGGLGLAVLHHSAWSPGTAVTITGGGDTPATVSELPFE